MGSDVFQGLGTERDGGCGIAGSWSGSCGRSCGDIGMGGACGRGGTSGSGTGKAARGGALARVEGAHVALVAAEGA